MHKMDALDRKILRMLCKNARFSDTEIARGVGSSRQLVSQRTERLHARGIIYRMQALIDMELFGYRLAVLVLRTASPERVCAALAASSLCSYVCESYGKWNVFAYLLFQDLSSIGQTVEGIVGNDALDLAILPISREHEYVPLFEGYFSGAAVTFPRRSRIGFQASFDAARVAYEPHKLDKDILRQLSLEARMPLARIASAVRTDVQLVKRRVDHLVRAGVIEGFYPTINQRKLGCLSHYLLLKFRPLSSRERAHVRRTIYSSGCVAYVGDLLGAYDVVVEAYSRDDADIASINGLLQRLAQRLVDFQLVLVTVEHKFLRDVPW